MQPIFYLWAAPTTSIGLLFVPLALISGGSIRVCQGVLEIQGGLVTTFLRKIVPLPGGASAMTLGHVVIAQDAMLLDLTRSHERIHVRQCERWGPFFIPAYFIGAIYARLRGRQAYRDNPFEREAFGHSSAAPRER
jgi:hypothetical protein